MGTTVTLPQPVVSQWESVPPLESGDRLTRDEFEVRYHAMPAQVKAELIEGVVYVASPVRITQHGEPMSDLDIWLGLYRVNTPGTESGDNSTIRLDLDNEPQPDILLRILPEFGGQSGTTADGYVDGAPELVAEVAASTASIDLHQKKIAYNRNGVQEYIVWRVLDGELDWFVRREEQYERLELDASGVYRSEQFPGLWLDVFALVNGDMVRVLTVLQRGIESAEHKSFVERLRGTVQAAAR